jgi:hypothetical protein
VLLAESTFEHVQEVRAHLASRVAPSVAEAAQSFVADLATTFSSVLLARVFVVVPFRALPAPDQAFARKLVGDDPRISAETRVLSLLGTMGRKLAWCDRLQSAGHLAVPLLDRAHVTGIPMIARLLGDLEVDFKGLDDKRSIASTPMLGGHNAKFLVRDAVTATNERGELVIPARDFVAHHGVRTVFGMGGSYVDGTLAVVVVFTDELVDDLTVSRFPSLISSFKMATAEAMAKGRIYA